MRVAQPLTSLCLAQATCVRRQKLRKDRRCRKSGTERSIQDKETEEPRTHC